MEPQTTLTAARLIVEQLKAEGVDHVFGIPGGPIMPLYAALEEAGGIRLILTKHEEGAAFMADGYARASGRVGVCCVTTGPGATNALTGLAVSQSDHVPVLLLSAQVPTHRFGKGAFQEASPETVDLVSLFKPATKHSTMIHHPASAGTQLRSVLRTMTSGCPGPAHLSLPLDYAGQSVANDVLAPARYRFGGRVFDREAVKEAARLLLDAKSPVLLAGQGVNLSRAWHPLRSLAERLSMPVATTFKAKGALPEDHPLSLGVFGWSGAERARDAVLGPETDLVFVVGSSLGEASSCGWDPRLAGKLLLQADADPERIGRNFPVRTALVGDAGTVLIELLYQVERLLKLCPELEPRRQAPPPPEESAIEEARAGRLMPQAVLRELRQALPRDAALFVDNGTIRLWSAQHFPVYEENSFFVNMGMASMGYAVAGAIGGRLARPDRPVVALCGDAAFAMNGTEVHTAVEHDAPVVWVVVNNGGLGMIHHGGRMQFGREFGWTAFRQPIDAAGMAEALGAHAYRASRPGELEEAVREALRLRRPAVVDAAVELSEAPPMGARVKALERDLNVAGAIK